MAGRNTTSQRYSAAAAEKFWSRRLASTDPLAAVLTYNARRELNLTYDEWERIVLLERLGKNLRGKRVLDLGAGVGRLSVVLAREGAEVIAVDNSRAMLEKTARSAARVGVSDQITTVHARSDELPIDDATIDFVVCFGLLEHLPEPERKRTLVEARRVLKRRGRLFVVVNNTENPLLKSRYPLKHQRPDGYFVTLVGLRWLRTTAARLRLRASFLAGNPAYGLLHYVLEPHSKQFGIKQVAFANMCRAALSMDLANQLPGPLDRIFASHFLVELRRH